MELYRPAPATASHQTFGELLRHLRRQAYMTQRDLALATGYSIGQICRFEQNQYVPDRPTLTARFIPALVAANDTATAERLLALAERARAAQRDGQRRPAPLRLVAGGSGPANSPLAALSPLPAPATPLLGREREVAAACALLRETQVRLLTITGAPGIGKTRLGLRVADELRADFAGRVACVPLAPHTDPDLLVPVLAHALGVHEQAGEPLLSSLKGALGETPHLLLLDNFEQIVGAAPLVAELLAAAPQLKLIVTSRRPLHLSGEHELVVAPLALPPSDTCAQDAAGGAANGPGSDLALCPNRSTAAELTRYAATQLFLARARAIKADLVVSDAAAQAIAEICRRLDGLPLAIELAAARVRLFPPQALLARLERRLPLLTAGARDLPERQQTLRATLDWSHQLLSAGERRLLARLGVFVGGCTLEAAETVCGATDDERVDVLDGLSALVDHSLVSWGEGPGGEPRLALLETIREYALEQLEASGEDEALRRRHADYYLALAEEAEPELRGAQHSSWADRLELEHANLRAALKWAFARSDGTRAGRMCAALAHYWYARNYLSEGRACLEQALALPDAASPLRDVRAKLLNGAGVLAYTQGDYARAFARLEEGLALARERGDQTGIAEALDGLGWAALVQGEHARARTYFAEGLALSKQLGQSHSLAVGLTSMGAMALVGGKHGRATLLCTVSLAMGRALGAKPVVGLCLSTLGTIALVQGDMARARARYEECLALCRELGNKLLTAVCLVGIAGVDAAQGRAPRAARLLGASEALLRTIGCTIPSVARRTYEQIVATTRSQLGEEAFAAAWAAGRALSTERAIAEGLGEARAPPAWPGAQTWARWPEATTNGPRMHE